MKKFMVICLGITIATVTIGGVYASTQNKVSLEAKHEIIKQHVIDGKITQEKANDIIHQLENCDGSSSRIGQNNGVSFGKGNGEGQRLGKGNGKGLRNGTGVNCMK